MGAAEVAGGVEGGIPVALGGDEGVTRGAKAVEAGGDEPGGGCEGALGGGDLGARERQLGGGVGGVRGRGRRRSRRGGRGWERRVTNGGRKARRRRGRHGER